MTCDIIICHNHFYYWYCTRVLMVCTNHYIERYINKSLSLSLVFTIHFPVFLPSKHN